jgi:hypothetical protein
MSPRSARSRAGAARRRLGPRLLSIILTVTVVAAGCSGGDDLQWDGVRLRLPDGWELLATSDERLDLADHVAELGERGVSVSFIPAPQTLPDDWRSAVVAQGATIETDQQVFVAGDVPATQLVIRTQRDGFDVREVLFVVPSRELVILVRPRLAPGDTDGPELLLDSLDGVRALLDQLELATPRRG